MSVNKNTEKLPEYCYAVSDFSKELIVLKRGVPGYFPTNISTPDAEKNRAMADHMNAKLGVTKAQEQAMSVGSLFGWHLPGANPSLYEESSQEQAVSPDEERSYILNRGERYLLIQTCDSGYDYTVYSRDFLEYDGGQYDDPNISMDEAIQIILEAFEMQDWTCVEYDADELRSANDRAESAQLAKLDARIKNAELRRDSLEERDGVHEQAPQFNNSVERTPL